MRVAMVGPFGVKPKGTMAVRALPLAQALARRGHTVRLILPPWSHPADAGRIWEEQGVAIENVAVAPRVAIPLRLVSRVREFQPDVLHVFKPKAYAGMVQWLFWQMRQVGMGRARIVLDEDDWEGAGGWNELEAYPRAARKFFGWQERWGLTHADAVTVASRELETIAWSLGVPREKVLYLPNGVNHLPAILKTGGQVRVELGLGDAPVILLYTRFFEFGLDRLVEILSQVLAANERAKVLVVGAGLKGEEVKFLARARARGWSGRVTQVGWVQMEALGGYFGASDVAIYPFDDTLINRTKAIVKLMDLLAAGMPVVGDAVGQIREYIVNGETGILVKNGDVDAFARGVLELLADREKRARMGQCAAARMAREYDWGSLAERMERGYQVSGSR